MVSGSTDGGTVEVLSINRTRYKLIDPINLYIDSLDLTRIA